ncbi:MAG: DUF1080 domain-containing protein [bacterium]|nr:DUF1080 domain-containing protein [bacterium]
MNRDVHKELQPRIQAELKQGDFNDVVLRCIDNRIDTWINGVPFGFIETKQDSAGRLRRGKIGLQLHDGKPLVVSFRNIRVKELSRDQSPFPRGVAKLSRESPRFRENCQFLWE